MPLPKFHLYKYLTLKLFFFQTPELLQQKRRQKIYEESDACAQDTIEESSVRNAFKFYFYHMIVVEQRVL